MMASTSSSARRTRTAALGFESVVSIVPTREQQSRHQLPRAAEVSIDALLEGNPSGRRQGVTIRFWCEGCAQRSVLTIAQHKGATLLEQKREAPSTLPLFERFPRMLPPAKGGS